MTGHRIRNCAGAGARHRRRRGAGMLLVFVVLVLFILGLMGFALSTQTQAVHTDAEILVARLLALSGARNAIAENIPIVVARINRYHMRVKLPSTYDAGSTGPSLRLAQSEKGNDADYQRFLSQYDDSPHYGLDSLTQQPLEPVVVSGPGGYELDFPEDPLYTDFRRSVTSFEAQVPAVLSRRVYMPYGSRAWVEPMRVKVLAAREDGAIEGAMRGTLAFTGECRMTVKRQAIRRALEVRRRFMLLPVPQGLPAMAEPGPVKVLTLDDAPSCEVIVTPRGDGGPT